MKNKAYNWPKEVPILEASDIIRGTNDRGKKHCLNGWRVFIFGCVSPFNGPNDDIPQIAHTKIQEAIKEVRCVPEVSYFNDTKPAALVARVWNRAMYLLGYTVGNKENKPLTGAK